MAAPTGSGSDLSFLSIRELATRLQKGLSPVELTEHFLDRLEKVGPAYNCVVTVLRERALEEARKAEAEIHAGRWRGILHGVPYGVKDLLAAHGGPTTWGAAPYKDQVFDHDADAVRRLKDAGAVLLAKLSMVELAGGMGYNHANASFNGPGLNPWNKSYWSGGSSSGPGAAVAAGLVPFAIGSETSGSILTPSSFCGVSGLRPTYGRVSRHGAMALSWTLDKLGPMSRSADDCGIVLSALAGREASDPTSVDRPFHYDKPSRPKKGLRIAVPKGVVEKAQAEVRNNFGASLAALRRMGTVTLDVEWPDLPWGPAVGAIVAAEGATAFLDFIESGKCAELACKASRGRGYAGAFVFAVDYIQAMRQRRPMQKAIAELFNRFDVIAAPTRATVAYPADQEFEKVYPDVSGGPPLIAAGNLCGLPALSVPNGFGENHLPTGISFLGAPFSEETLVAVGNAYQAATDWHLQFPTVA
ncbi:MAG TPA: amidase [Candidatus Eisenbacteria bacterium]|nr:amidase [Candidatus Eisenbacteria bacterium]